MITTGQEEVESITIEEEVEEEEDITTQDISIKGEEDTVEVEVEDIEEVRAIEATEEKMKAMDIGRRVNKKSLLMMMESENSDMRSMITETITMMMRVISMMMIMMNLSINEEETGLDFNGIADCEEHFANSLLIFL